MDDEIPKPAQAEQGERDSGLPKTKDYPYGEGLIRERTVENIGEKSAYVSLEYIDPSGKSIRFNDLLPDGWNLYHSGRVNTLTAIRFKFFDEKETGSVSFGNKVGEFKRDSNDIKDDASYQFFEKPGDIFKLLHEIGHAQSERSPQEWKDMERVRQRQAIGENPNEVIWKRLVLPEERNAWAFAISTLRELRRQGIDCEPEIKNNSDLARFMHMHLSSYEQFVVDKSSEDWGKYLDTLFSPEDDDTVREIVKRAVRPIKTT